MSENNANASAKILKEIAGELQKIKEQTQLLQSDVQNLLERHWVFATHHIVPIFENWKRAVDASQVVTYARVDATFQLLPSLSASPEVEAVTQFSMNDLTQKFEPHIASSIAHCCANRELQLCSSAEALVLPFCLFDDVSALVIAHVQNFQSKTYEHYVNVSRTFLENLRHELFKPEWWDVIVLPKAQ